MTLWQGLLWSNEQQPESEPLRLWTIGHSTRSLEEFLSLLREHRIDEVIDVRRFPASRRYPHFNRLELEAELTIAGITYLWLPVGTKLYKRNPEHLANRVEVAGLFWHFVDLVWIFVFPLFYLL